jgi:hypothetical protein
MWLSTVPVSGPVAWRNPTGAAASTETSFRDDAETPALTEDHYSPPGKVKGSIVLTHLFWESSHSGVLKVLTRSVDRQRPPEWVLTVTEDVRITEFDFVELQRCVIYLSDPSQFLKERQEIQPLLF